MKKIIAFTALYILMTSSNLFSQSNLVWTFNGELPKGFMKTSTIFNSTFSGFKNATEVTKFSQTFKSNPDVATCDIISTTSTTCVMKITMKQIHDKPYYINLAKKIGVAYISANGSRKSLDELKQGKK